MKYRLRLILCLLLTQLAARNTCADEADWNLQPLKYYNPGLVVDLGVGLPRTVFFTMYLINWGDSLAREARNRCRCHCKRLHHYPSGPAFTCWHVSRML